MFPLRVSVVRPLGFLFVTALAATACERRTGQPTAPLQANEASTLSPGSDYIRTPSGWYHRSCVHEIPNGAHVGEGGLVTRVDGSTFQIPKCAYQATPRASLRTPPAAPP